MPSRQSSGIGSDTSGASARSVAVTGAKIGASVGSRAGPVAAGIGSGFGGAVGYLIGSTVDGVLPTPDGGRRIDRPEAAGTAETAGREGPHDRAAETTDGLPNEPAAGAVGEALERSVRADSIETTDREGPAPEEEAVFIDVVEE